MSDDKAKVVPISRASRLQPAGGKSANSCCARTAGVQPQPEESLRLINAFIRIGDPSTRARLIEEAEKLAHG